jgi:hypothetical protein
VPSNDVSIFFYLFPLAYSPSLIYFLLSGFDEEIRRLGH